MWCLNVDHMIKAYVHAVPGLHAPLKLPLAIMYKQKKKALWIMAYVNIMNKVVNSLQCIASITVQENGEPVVMLLKAGKE